MFDPSQRTALHFSMPLDALDWANLAASGCRLVQLPWGQALDHSASSGDGGEHRTQLDRLTAAGYSVILRMGTEDAAALSFDRAGLRVALAARLAETNGRGLDAVIVFNEPDIGPDGKPIDLSKVSADWHQAAARQHAVRTAAVRDAIGDMVRLVAAPLSNRLLSEDARPEPGLMEWWTELRPVYHSPAIKGVGVHIYEQFLNEDPAAVDTQRAKHKLYLWGTFWQPDLWVDEFQVTHGTQLERARAWVAMGRLLMRAPESIMLFSPFVSNGLGNAYGADMIIRDPAAYIELSKLTRG